MTAVADDTAAQDADYAYFVGRVRVLTGIDLSGYKAPQMQRRLLALAARHGQTTLRAFAHAIEREPLALQAFRNFFTINVSEFFRDPPRWRDLAEKLLPRLAAETRSGLRIWSAGCSIGAEPYSLAILLDELYPRLPYTLLATDIDETVLARARGGGYGEADLRNVSAERRAHYFQSAEDGTWSIAAALRGRVTFRRHDLLGQEAGRGFDLIVCRNVVIYFTDAAKQDLYGRFQAALRPGGALFVGGTEVVGGARALGLEPWLTSLYIAGARPAQAAHA